MHMYMYICLYLYISICIYVAASPQPIYICICICLYVYMSICIYIYMYICLYVYISICIYVAALPQPLPLTFFSYPWRTSVITNFLYTVITHLPRTLRTLSTYLLFLLLNYYELAIYLLRCLCLSHCGHQWIIL